MALAMLVLALIVAACGGDDEGDATASAARPGPRLAAQWAGKVEGTNSYISVFTLDNGEAGAYLADGAEVAALVLGERDGSDIELEPSKDVDVKAEVSGDTVSGTVTLAGERHHFYAAEATGDAGWYRTRTTVDGDEVAAGYIVVADGTQRGAVRCAGKVVAAPRFDPDKPTIDVDGIGALTIEPVAQFVAEEGGLS
jgi:hypothetical protein